MADTPRRHHHALLVGADDAARRLTGKAAQGVRDATQPHRVLRLRGLQARYLISGHRGCSSPLAYLFLHG